MQDRGPETGAQLALFCACGKKPIAVKRLSCCRSCYDRRQHSLRFFGGLRERVLERDGLRCRGCGSNSALVVHHRAPENQPELLITLCIRCHLRIHRALGSRYWFPRILIHLWQDLWGRRHSAGQRESLPAGPGYRRDWVQVG